MWKCYLPLILCIRFGDMHNHACFLCQLIFDKWDVHFPPKKVSSKTNNISSKRDAEMLPPPYFMHKIWRHAQSRASDNFEKCDIHLLSNKVSTQTNNVASKRDTEMLFSLFYA